MILGRTRAQGPAFVSAAGFGYGPLVRKVFLFVSIVVACWFGGQSTVAAMAPYSDCCVAGYTDLAACVDAGCTTCLSEPRAVPRLMVMAAFEPAQTALDTSTPEWVSVSVELWKPPG